LLPILLILLEYHVFKNVEEVVDSLAVELGVFVSVGTQVILRNLFVCLGIDGVACHINDSDRTHLQVFMPEMKFDEHVSLVIDRSVRIVSGGFFEVSTILFDSFKKEQKLMRL